MEKIGFYPLTLILSYLTEQEGVLLLTTKRKFACHILPIFLVRTTDHDAAVVELSNRNDDDDDKISDNIEDRKWRLRKNYQFKVSPVQDPTVLLDRLNTRRWYQRRRRFPHLHGGTSPSSNVPTTIHLNHRNISDRQALSKSAVIGVDWLSSHSCGGSR